MCWKRLVGFWPLDVGTRPVPNSMGMAEFVVGPSLCGFFVDVKGLCWSLKDAVSIFSVASISAASAASLWSLERRSAVLKFRVKGAAGAVMMRWKPGLCDGRLGAVIWSDSGLDLGRDAGKSWEGAALCLRDGLRITLERKEWLDPAEISRWSACPWSIAVFVLAMVA